MRFVFLTAVCIAPQSAVHPAAIPVEDAAPSFGLTDEQKAYVIDDIMGDGPKSTWIFYERVRDRTAEPISATQVSRYLDELLQGTVVDVSFHLMVYENPHASAEELADRVMLTELNADRNRIIQRVRIWRTFCTERLHGAELPNPIPCSSKTRVIKGKTETRMSLSMNVAKEYLLIERNKLSVPQTALSQRKRPRVDTAFEWTDDPLGQSEMIAQLSPKDLDYLQKSLVTGQIIRNVATTFEELHAIVSGKSEMPISIQAIKDYRKYLLQPTVRTEEFHDMLMTHTGTSEELELKLRTLAEFNRDPIDSNILNRYISIWMVRCIDPMRRGVQPPPCVRKQRTQGDNTNFAWTLTRPSLLAYLEAELLALFA